MTEMETTKIGTKNRKETRVKSETETGTEIRVISETETGTETRAKIETKTETKTETGTKSGIETRTESEIENGSPAARPWTNIVSQGTAGELSTAGDIKSPAKERTVITAGTVSPDRLPQAISKEVFTYKGIISEILIRRTDQDEYAITLLTRTPKVRTPKVRTPKVRTPKVRSPKTGASSSPRGGRHAD